MSHKRINLFARAAVVMFMLSLHVSSYAAIAYMPQDLRNCINQVYEMAQPNNGRYKDLAELHNMIAENRIFSPENVMRKGLREAFLVLKNNRKNAAYRAQIEQYLHHYNNELDNMAVIFSLNNMQGEQRSWPLSVVAESLADGLENVDMMCLSSALHSVDNLQLCGYAKQQTRLFDATISMNASMMTNAIYPAPNVMFGTGVSSPVITAWSMAPSFMIQSPINMQLAVPSALLIERAEMLDLHFLVAQQGFENGKARVGVQVKYMGQYGEFDIFDESPLFTYIVESEDFKVIEPMHANQVRHICVTVPLEKTLINKCNFIVMSITRTQPQAEEYMGEIFLAASVLRYTQL